MPPEQIATLYQALDDAALRYRSELHEDAAHGSTMADTQVYDHAARRTAFHRAIRAARPNDRYPRSLNLREPDPPATTAEASSRYLGRDGWDAGGAPMRFATHTAVLHSP